MKFKILNTALVSFILSTATWCNIANAGLITETWNFKITEVHGNYLTKSVDDIFSLSFDYDDSSLIMHRYNDNDTVVTLCAGSAAGGASCDASSTLYSMYADLIDFRGFDNLFDAASMSANGGYIYDRISYTEERRQTKIHVSGQEYVKVQNDVIDFYAQDSNLLAIRMAGLSFKYKNASGFYQSSKYVLDLNNISRTSRSVDVPEPSTLAIFALGMMGLASRRFKK